MARTIVQAADMTQDSLQRGIVDQLLKIDQSTAAMVAQAQTTSAPTIKINRLTNLPTTSFINCSSTISSENLQTSAASFDLQWMLTQADICKQVADLYSSETDQSLAEINACIKSLSEKLAETIMIGDGTGDSFRGLQTLNVQEAAATADLIADMDNMFDEVRTGGQKVFIGSPAVVNAVKAELRSQQSLNDTILFGTEFNLPAYGGVPLLKNQWTPSGELYLVDITPSEGYGLVFGNNGLFEITYLDPSKSDVKPAVRIENYATLVQQNILASTKRTGVS